MKIVDDATHELDQIVDQITSSDVAPADRGQEAAQKLWDERRAHRRMSGEALAWIDVARVKYGPQVTIIDLSIGGAELESNRPLAPGSRHALEIVGPNKSLMVPFAVVRSRISSLSPRGATYRAACAFIRPLELPELAVAVAAGDAGPVALIEPLASVRPIAAGSGTDSMLPPAS